MCVHAFRLSRFGRVVLEFRRVLTSTWLFLQLWADSGSRALLSGQYVLHVPEEF